MDSQPATVLKFGETLQWWTASFLGVLVCVLLRFLWIRYQTVLEDKIK